MEIEAYSFMRYGYRIGEVEHVSPDAVIDVARGLVFPARMRVTGSRIRPLEPNIAVADIPSDYDALLRLGLSAAVEMKSGRRSVLNYLLSPVARSLSAAGRKR